MNDELPPCGINGYQPPSPSLAKATYIILVVVTVFLSKHLMMLWNHFDIGELGLLVETLFSLLLFLLVLLLLLHMVIVSLFLCKILNIV